MATLVLTAVGTALGGPVGGALGGLVGQAIDTQLFGPGPRRGPRLDDLKVQTSSYGTQIPRIYGRMRVAGTVIWATDFQETEAVEGGGKGSPEVVQYSYSCSFAVALSSRPILGIGRIWADGKLIRGTAGDLKVRTGFRVATGSEEQEADPLIAAIEGGSGTPAYRALALAVFEDMSLAEFGNRLPMLTFEVLADDGPVDVERILADASEGAIVAEGGSALSGFAAFGSDRRAALGQLVELSSRRVGLRGDMLVGTAPRMLTDADALGCSADRKDYPGTGEWTQDAATSLPTALSIRYHDPSRDYLAGEMRATIPGGRGEMIFDSAAAMLASDAKGLAGESLGRRWAGRDRLSLRLPPDYLDLVPGETIEFAWRGGRWLVEEVVIDSFVVLAELRRLASAGAAAPADPGRGNGQVDVPIGTSVIRLLDLPDIGGSTDGKMRLHAVIGAQGAFKPVPISARVNGIAGPSGLATRRARLGATLSALEQGRTELLDLASSVEVQMVDSTQWLLNADDDALDGGANLCLIGRELVQFGRAEDLGGGRFRLSHFLRGRRGTEWAIAGHSADEPFTMIDAVSFVPLSFDEPLFGQPVGAEAHGIADDVMAPPVAIEVLGDMANAPLSPCHLAISAGADVVIRWTRRARTSWAWLDGFSPEDQGAGAIFEVNASGISGRISRIVATSECAFEVAELQAIGPGEIEIAVVELGHNRRSQPASINFVN